MNRESFDSGAKLRNGTHIECRVTYSVARHFGQPDYDGIYAVECDEDGNGRWLDITDALAHGELTRLDEIAAEHFDSALVDDADPWDDDYALDMVRLARESLERANNIYRKIMP